MIDELKTNWQLKIRCFFQTKVKLPNDKLKIMTTIKTNWKKISLRKLKSKKEKLSVHIKSITQNYCISNGLTSIKIISLLPPKIDKTSSSIVVDAKIGSLLVERHLLTAGRESFFFLLSLNLHYWSNLHFSRFHFHVQVNMHI